MSYSYLSLVTSDLDIQKQLENLSSMGFMVAANHAAVLFDELFYISN